METATSDDGPAACPDPVQRVKLFPVSDETITPTPIPARVSTDEIRLLVERRKAGKMTGVWLSIEAVESMLTEVELYRAKHDPAMRRQKDAARAQRNARERWNARPSPNA